ncbi:MAG: DUF2905 domain-containing protein [Chloroflexota bacterium]
MDTLAKTLIILGVVIALLGVILLIAGRIPFLGRLPGDIIIQRDGFVFYFPLMTSIIVSILLTIVLTVIGQFMARRGG